MPSRTSYLLPLLSAGFATLLSCGDGSPTGPGGVVHPPGTFQRVIGAGNWESGDAVRMTPDGGYLVLGTGGSLFGGTILAVKTDAGGKPISQRPLRADAFQQVRDAVSTDDGGMTAVASGQEILLLKFDQNGLLEWQQPIGGLNQLSGLTVAQTLDGGYMVVGGTGNDIGQTQALRFVKTDALGNMEWDTFTEESSRQVWALGVTPAGDFVLAGAVRNPGEESFDIYLGKTDAHAEIQWEKSYGGPGTDVAWSLAVLERGIALAGNRGDDSFVMETTEDGEEVWLKTYNVGFIGGIVPLRDGGVMIAGATNASPEEAYLARIDSQGAMKWMRSFGRAGADIALGVAVAQNGFALTGRSVDPGAGDYDILLVRTDAGGNAPAMERAPKCPDPVDPPPAPPLPDPLVREWRLARGPVNEGSFEGFAQQANGDVYGVYARHIFRFTGTAWETVDTQAPNLLFDIAAVEDNYMVAVGMNHTILTFNGNVWTSYASPAPHFSYEVLGSVWGSSRSNVFAAGNSGAIVHFDGTSWTKMESGTTENVLGVWGTGPNDVWAVSQFGTILHYNGSIWAPVHEHEGELRGVWGASSNDVYVVGLSGVLLHYDGVSWSSLTVTSAHLSAISGRSGGDVYVVGRRSESEGAMFHFDGTSWTDISAVITGSGPPPLNDVLAGSAGRVFVSRGDLDIRVHWFDGASWHASTQEQPTLRSVWAHSRDYAIAAGDDGEILRWNGTTWEPMASGAGVELHAAYGFAENDVFVGARDGSIRHFDGTEWKEMFSPASYINDMWGSAPDDVYAAGAQLIHYDGREWVDVTPRGSHGMWGTWGISAADVYAVYDTGVWHFDGCEWSKIRTGSETLRAVWCQPGPLVYAVGDRGAVVRYSGASWEPLATGTSEYFTSVWGRGANDIFVVGNSIWAGYYVMRHYDGNSWTTPPRQSSFALNDVYGTPDGAVFAVGNGGVIVQGLPE
jgi:hypothetical protein